MTTPYLSVVVPAYNEEVNLSATVRSVMAKLDELQVTHEVVIVDDASSDGTLEQARALAAGDGRIRVERHETNRGPGSGVFTGIEVARGAYVIFIPADLALDLDHLYKYIDGSREADIVVGLRSDRRDYSLARKCVSYINIFLVRTLFGMRERQFNYIHCYRRAVLDLLNIESRGVFITAEILIKARDLGYRLVQVEIPYVPRVAGVATCGRVSIILKTVRDLLRLWIRRSIFRRRYWHTIARAAT